MASTQNYGPTPGSALPVAQTVTGTAEVMVASANPAALTSVPSTLQASQAGALPVVLTTTVPANSILDGKLFEFLVSGSIACAAAMNATVKLYGAKVALSATPGSNTLLGSSGAIAYAGAATNPFWARFKGVFDSASGKLDGTVQFFVNHTLVAEAAVSNVITGLTDTANPILNFGLSVTFSVAEAAGNIIAISEGGCAVNF